MKPGRISSGCVGGPGQEVVIAGVTVCATPRWPRKRPALLDRPVSILAARRWLISRREEREGERERGSMSLDSIMSGNRGGHFFFLFFVITGTKWKKWEQRAREVRGGNYSRRVERGAACDYGYALRHRWINKEPAAWPSLVCPAAAAHLIFSPPQKTFSHYLPIRFDLCGQIVLIGFFLETRQMDSWMR